MSAPANRRRFLRNLPLGVKIAAGFGSLLFLMAVVAIVAWTGLGQVGAAATSADRRTANAIAIEQLVVKTTAMALDSYTFMVTEDPAEIDLFNANAAAARTHLRTVLDGLAGSPHLDRAREIERALAGLETSFADIVRLTSDRRTQANNGVNTYGPEAHARLTEIRVTAVRDGDPAAGLAAAEMQEVLALTRLQVVRFLYSGDKRAAEEALRHMTGIEQSLQRLRGELQNARRIALLGETVSYIERYRASFEALLGIHDRREVADAAFASSLKSLEEVAKVVAGAVIGEAEAAGQSLRTQVGMTQILIKGGFVAALFLGSLIAILIYRATVEPVRMVTEHLMRLAHGDGAFEVRSKDRRDEIGSMLRAVSVLRDTVRKAFAQAQMIDEIPTPVMVADPRNEFRITYVNKATTEMLKRISRHLPVPADAIVGQSLDIFHKDPAHPRRILSHPDNLPWRAKVRLGDEVMDLRISAIVDKDGTYVGPMLSWQIVTQQEKLATDFEGNVKGTIDQLVGSLRNVETRMHSMVASARRTSAQSSSVAAAAEQASANVQTVASASEELAASIIEIGRQMQQTSEMAIGASQQVERAAERVEALAEVSRRIEQVVSLIESIAGQTNLLALNATIEAARAGDAGKGFAVVAGEVKALANQTAKATEDVSTEVRSIQAAVDQVVGAVRDVLGTIREMRDVFTGVAAAVEEQQAATAEISRNVQEAARGTQQVTTEIVEVKDATDATGASAEEVLKVAGELMNVSSVMGDKAAAFLKDVRAA